MLPRNLTQYETIVVPSRIKYAWVFDGDGRPRRSEGSAITRLDGAIPLAARESQASRL
ncbi:hypothetical protein GCM10011408_06010 [Dyella caseinilytica]|nr:hypothetical protein GCM10011408_06010 [Dyella caseinilytica]